MKMEQIVFQYVGIQNWDAGELPRRKHTIFRTQRKFEIKNNFNSNVNKNKAILHRGQLCTLSYAVQILACKMNDTRQFKAFTSFRVFILIFYLFNVLLQTVFLIAAIRCRSQIANRKSQHWSQASDPQMVVFTGRGNWNGDFCYLWLVQFHTTQLAVTWWFV